INLGLLGSNLQPFFIAMLNLWARYILAAVLLVPPPVGAQTAPYCPTPEAANAPTTAAAVRRTDLPPLKQRQYALIESGQAIQADVKNNQPLSFIANKLAAYKQDILAFLKDASSAEDKELARPA